MSCAWHSLTIKSVPGTGRPTCEVTLSKHNSPRVAAITGASSGLGRALAVELARRGYHVAIADVDADGADETLCLVRAVGGSGFFMELDVRDPEALEAFASQVMERYERCDLLINNAGVGASGRVGEASLDDWRWCLDINLRGPIYGCHVFVPIMRRQGFGHIVNIASIAAYAQAPRMGPYNVSKAGVVALSESLRAELHGSGVGVSVVCPAFFPTKIASSMRFTDPREQSSAQRLVDASSLSAADVSIAILEAVERKEPFVVLPAYARLIFLTRRLFPALMTDLLAFMRKMRR